MQGRMPIVRRACGRFSAAGEGSGTGDSGQGVRIKQVATMDKFSNLAALKPVRTAMPLARPLSEALAGDDVTRLLGGLCQKTKFGQHLAIRNWYSTPEFAEPTGRALDLLAQQKDQAIPEK